VVVADIDFAEAVKSAETLPGPAVAVEHDVREAESSEELLKQALGAYGRVDVLVNNAGVGPKPGPLQDTTEEEYDRVMDVNARGVFLTTRALVPQMIEQKGGRIINISSIVGQSGFAMVLPYVASKFAVTGMTQSMAHEFAPHNITVNSIHPGILETELHTAVVKQFSALMGQEEQATWDWFMSRIPLQRFQTPTDIGEMAAFLASDRAQNITGASFNVDGGWEMH
jgi:NAD(P)-dependent dehydrogenase (short-subunit alcohol dehydrogenase family)